MPSTGDDISRLKNLLSEGHSVTDAARIMEISRSTAQRLKKRIQESSNVDGDLDLRWGFLGENAVTLRVAGPTMKQMLDWTKTIYWNKDKIFQFQGDYWLTYPLGDRLQHYHTLNESHVKPLVLNHLSEVLDLPNLSHQNGYTQVTKYLSLWDSNWVRDISKVLRTRYINLSYEGDLGDRYLPDDGYSDNGRLILEAVSNAPQNNDATLSGWILMKAYMQLGGNQQAEVSDEIKSMLITSTTTLWLMLCKLNSEEFDQLPIPKDYVDYVDTSDEFDQTKILKNYTDLSNEIIDYMVEHNNFNTIDVELVVFGGINEMDLEFAKRGNFRNEGELELAKDKSCTNREELDNVMEFGWESGEELRKAESRYGVSPNNRQLYLNMVEINPLVNWTGEWKMDLLEWADLADEEDFQRLRGFPHPKAMKFFEDVLLLIDEESVRTDYLMRDYNEINAPGDFISDEEEFKKILSNSCFKNFVNVGKGGVSSIDFGLLGKEKEDWKPKAVLNYNDFVQLKKSRKKASKELKEHLDMNQLEKSLTGAYDWLVSNLRTMLEVGKKEEILVIDELEELLGFDRKTKNNLHQARMARNFVAHPFEAEEIPSTWDLVELCLKTAEDLLNLEL